MEFRILGPLEVETDGRPIPLAGPKQRAVLVLLLLARGRTVTTERLIEDVWNGTPPGTALKSVQVYVSQLRRALGGGKVLTKEHGYALTLAPGELDVDRFDELVRRASDADAAEAVNRLNEALALFRGEPLEEFEFEAWAESERTRLSDARRTAVAARIEAELALGLHAGAVPELERLVAENPFDEHLLELLVLALYRSGRQADALAAHRRGVAALRSELGLEPGRTLRELEQRILRHADDLAAPRRVGARRRSWKLVVAGALIVVIAALAAAVVVATRGSSVALASVSPGVAIVDANSGRLVDHIDWNDLKWPAEVMTGDGSFWVWSLDGYSMVRVDPRNGHVLGRVGSPFGADALGAVVDGSSIWFTGRRLVRTDLATGEAIDTYALSRNSTDDGLAGIARGGGSLWIARHLAGELLRVDPSTGAVQRVFKGLPSAYTVAYGDGGAWVVTFDGVSRVDAATNVVVHVSLPPPVAEVAVGGGYAWVSNEAKGVVYKISRSGQVVDTYTTGDGAREMSYADGTLWVTNQDVGTITSIDAATGAERTLRFGHPLESVAALHGRLLVEINQGRTYEDRIAALNGRVLRLFGPIYEFDHPDPAISGNGYLHSFIFQAERATCAPLLGYPDAPPPRGQQLVPEVATALPSLSGDRRTYTFTVRSGFRFAPPSNAPLDAATIRFSIERALSPKLGPRAKGIRFLGDLVGIRDYRAGRADHVAGIRVHGDRISFTLTRPSPDFLERLALPYFCPVPRNTPTVDGGVGVYTGPAPAGAGPYSFRGLVFNGEYEILERNPNYGGRRPQRLDAVAFREGVDTGRAAGRVVGGRYDGLQQYDTSLSPGGSIATATASPLAYTAFPARSTSYIALDAGTAPFTEPRVRDAVASVLNRRELAAFWSLTPTSRLLPPGVRGVDAATIDPSARAAAAHVRDTTVRMAVQANDDRARSFGSLVAAALERLGLRVELVPVADLAAVLHDRRTHIHMAALTTTIDYPDPASFLSQIFGHDIPASWLPPGVMPTVWQLDRLAGRARDLRALVLARRLERAHVALAYGTRFLGTITGPRVGCRIWNGVDPALDVAALCLR